jgi:galactokinase
MQQRTCASEDERIGTVVGELRRRTGEASRRVEVVRSPYRACPLGAHVDHQMGRVTGLALNRCLLLAFAGRDDSRVVANSRQFPGSAEFDLCSVQESPVGDWADYLRGAAVALRRHHRLDHGISALVDGHRSVGGLSSSAAAGVAYILALARVNDLSLSPQDCIELDRLIENDYIGLRNGVLDQATIVLGRAGRLVDFDCRLGRSRLVPFGGSERISLAVLFSGLATPLAATAYNARVRECEQAAAQLLRCGGLSSCREPVLADVPVAVFEEYGRRLPEALRRRAAHFFGEKQRVALGVKAWREGDLDSFGALVSESGRSSIENYQCGNRYLRAAHAALVSAPGVYGGRFSGGGFRGCCIGLVRPGSEPDVHARAMGSYLSQFPEMAGAAELFFCGTGNGARVL